MVALADLLNRDAARAAPAGPLAPKPTHFPAKAKAVIWLFMEGAPSGVDLFDPKPELDKNDGKRIKIDVFNGNPGPLMKSPFKFKQHGKSGAWVCDKYPNVAKHVDDIAFVKSLLHRVERPRPGAVPDQHRHRPARVPVGRGVGHLRPREREPEPARVRRAREQPGGEGRAAQLVGRVPARRPTRGRCSGPRGTPS